MVNYKFKMNFKEERLKEHFCKIADEAVSKIQHCKMMLKDHNSLPLMTLDVGAEEVNIMMGVLMSISTIRDMRNTDFPE